MSLNSKISQSDKNVDNVYITYLQALEIAVAKIEKDIIKLVASNPNPATIKAQVQMIVNKSGYLAVVDDYLEAGYQSILNESYNLYDRLYDQRFNFSQDSLDSFVVRKSQDLDRFTGLTGGLVNDVNKQIVNSSAAGIAADLTEEAVSGLVATFNNHSTLELETSVARAYRAGNTQLAQDNGIELFQYAGPVSGNIRPFCLANVGKIRSFAKWNELDNGKQPKPVSEFQGGYRCRHSFVGVPEGVEDDFEEIEKDVRAQAAARETA